MREVDLRLASRRRFEPDLKTRRRCRAHVPQNARDRRVPTRKAKFSDLAPQSPAAQFREGGDPLA
jgi:hypothetical protein